MINPAVWNGRFDIVANFKTCRVGIGENQDPILPGQTAQKRQLFPVFENAEPVGHQNRAVHQSGQAYFIVFAFDDDGLAQVNHRPPSCWCSAKNRRVTASCIRIWESVRLLFSW